MLNIINIISIILIIVLCIILLVIQKRNPIKKNLYYTLISFLLCIIILIFILCHYYIYAYMIGDLLIKISDLLPMPVFILCLKLFFNNFDPKDEI